MKHIKPHFLKLNKRQRRGVLFLSLLVIIFQIIYFLIDFTPDNTSVANIERERFINDKIDSIKLVKSKNNIVKIFPFNPNFLTDFKASKLGMTVDEIDRLFAFRKTGKYVNSTIEFQQVTKINDSLLAKIRPFFKFPEWVNKKVKFKDKNSVIKANQYTNQKPLNTQDINTATSKDLQQINGIGEALSARIIKYRDKLGGFYFKDQLGEVYGLSPQVVKRVNQYFKILSKPKIKKININEATFKQVLHLPYIDYELTKKIFSYRDEFAEIQSLEELKKIEGFPLDKYDRIILYLSTE
jgi:competence ComEA-like helix-hairpin-helix protein